VGTIKKLEQFNNKNEELDSEIVATKKKIQD